MGWKGCAADYLHRLKGSGARATVVRAAAGTFAVKIAGAGTGFAAHVLLARFMGVNEYGIFVYVFLWTRILALVTRLGFHTSLVRFIPEYRVSRAWDLFRGVSRRSFQYVAVFSGTIAVAACFFASTFSGIVGVQRLPAFIAAFAGLPFLALIGVEYGILKGLKRPALANLPEFVLRPGLLLLAAVLLHFWKKGTSLTAPVATVAHTGVMGVAFVAGILLVSHSMPLESRKEKTSLFADKRWLSVSLPMLLITGMYMLSRQTSLIIVGALGGNAAAGVFGAITRIGALVTFGLSAVNMIAAPMISELYHERDLFQLQRLLTMAAWGIFGYTVLVAGVFGAGGKLVLQFFGPEFVAGYLPLLVLLAGQAVNALAGSVGFIMLMTGHQNQAAFIVAGAVAVNLCAGLILVPPLGVMGGALATFCGTAFWNFAMVIYVRRKLDLNPTIFRMPASPTR